MTRRKEKQRFCASVVKRSEPRHEGHGPVFLRQNDWQLDAPGMPVVPARLEGCFRGQHAATPVTAVDGRGVFRVAGGFAQGFHRDEPISLIAPSGELAHGVLFKVEENESWGDSEQRSKGIEIDRGWIVTATSGSPLSQ